MKKIILSATFIMFLAFNTFGQDTYIGFKTGFLLSGSIQFYEGYLDVGPSTNWGITIGRKITRNSSLEFEYFWANNSEMNFYYNPFYAKDDFSEGLQIHNFCVNRIAEYPINSAISGFTITGAGLDYFNVASGGDRAFFAINLGAGLKINLSDNFDIGVQGRFLMPLVFRGIGYFIGVGSGGVDSGFSINSTVPIVQGDLALQVHYKF